MATWQTPKEDWTSAPGVSAADFNRIEGNTSVLKATADAALPAASYTAADVLTKIKTVDGTGSGLDADLLDSLQASDFMRSTAAISVAAGDITTYNFASGGQYAVGPSVTSMPVNTQYWNVLCNRTAVDGWDLWAKSSSDANQIYVGSKVNGAWTGWKEMWHSGNTPQTRDNAGVFEFLTGGSYRAVGGVKNVQRGTAVGPNDGTTTFFNITIAAVNLSKSFLSDVSVHAPTGNAPVGVTARLINTTTIQVETGSGGGNGAIVAWEVVESY